MRKVARFWPSLLRISSQPGVRDTDCLVLSGFAEETDRPKKCPDTKCASLLLMRSNFLQKLT